MGDAVDITYTDGPLYDSVDAIINKYQYGHFDGMTDMYESNNNRKDIPQAKYVHIRREMPADTRESIKDDLVKKFGIENPDNEKDWMNAFGYWSDQVIWREFQERPI